MECFEAHCAVPVSNNTVFTYKEHPLCFACCNNTLWLARAQHSEGPERPSF
jgi:hypothetical protein